MVISLIYAISSLLFFVYCEESKYGCKYTNASLECSDIQFLPTKLTSINSLAIVNGNSDDVQNYLSKLWSTSLQNLKLKDNGVTLLPSSLFVSLPSLQSLDIVGGHLNSFSFESGSEKLQHLNLDYNNINASKTIKHICSLFSNLQSLSLRYNHFTELTGGILKRCRKLQKLNLEFNEIKKINDATFDGAVSLHHLNISYNELRTFALQSFGNTLLKEFDASHNRITTIRNEGQMANMPLLALDHITSLHLSHNKLNALSDGVFHNMKSLRYVDLSYNSLSSFKSSWVFQAKMNTLNLSHNKITVLDDTRFLYKDLVNFDLSFNLLSTMPELSLQSLQRLHLDNNCLYNLSDNIFSKLESLQYLSIANNLLQWNVTLHASKVLAGLFALQYLQLSNNSIEYIAQTSFASLTSLKTLILSDNPVKFVDAMSFSNLPKLSHFVFNSSLLYCDCELKGFKSFIQSQSFPNVIARCGHPSSKRGKFLTDLADSDLTCVGFSRPKLNSHPRPHFVIVHKKANLYCSIRINCTLSYDIHWSFNQQTLTNAQVKNVCSNNTVSSELTIPSVQFHDEGLYSCSLSSDLSFVKSDEALLNVYETPRFTSDVSSNMTLRLESDKSTLLKCSATGRPSPVVSWKKIGGFPKQWVSRVHHIHTSSSSPQNWLKIHPLRQEDVGVYVCTATNNASSISHAISLRLLVTPTIERGLKDKVIYLSQDVILTCLSRGEPTPKIKWTKDESEMVNSTRHEFARHGQMLIILNPQYSDAGRYRCEASNTVGKTISEAYIQVQPPSSSLLMDSLAGPDAQLVWGVAIIIFVSTIVVTSCVWVGVIYRSRRLQRKSYFPTSHTEETIIRSEINPRFAYPPPQHTESQSGGDTVSNGSNGSDVTHIYPPAYMANEMQIRYHRHNPSEHSAHSHLSFPIHVPLTDSISNLKNSEVTPFSNLSPVRRVGAAQPIRSAQPLLDTPSYCRQPRVDNYQPNINVQHMRCSPPPVPARQTLPRPHKVNDQLNSVPSQDISPHSSSSETSEHDSGLYLQSKSIRTHIQSNIYVDAPSYPPGIDC